MNNDISTVALGPKGPFELYLSGRSGYTIYPRATIVAH